MTDNNERAHARMARASWGLFSRGARRHVERARDWVRAEGIEEHMREEDARAVSARVAADARARARKGKRAHVPSRPVRARTDFEIKRAAFGARALRSGCALAIPCAIIGYPVYALAHGEPFAVIMWPLAYGYLVWDGWVHRDDESREDSPTTEIEGEQSELKPSLLSKRRRTTNVQPTTAEAAIMARIDDWEQRAPERKLQEVIPGHPVIDESGLLIPIDLAGQWTPAKLDVAVDQVRALLAVPDGVRTQVKPGGTADRVLLRVRTRIRELDLAWTPERKGLGLDAETAEGVHINTDDRILVAGTSGSGKSVALRVIMADVLSEPNTALVILDLKKVEGALWRHTARVEIEPEGIQDVVNDLIAEMKEREDIMEARGDVLWQATSERPKIVVVVDEGAELMAEVPDCVGGLRSLARRARAARILLVWGTQKPTMTGNGPGLDSQISGQLTTKVCLAVAGAKETRVVFGEEATGNGWHAEELELGGWALVQVQGEKRTPNPMRVWFMDIEHVQALPAREPWRRKGNRMIAAAPDALSVALRLSEGLFGVSTAKLAEALNMTDVQVHTQMRVYGVAPEANAFAMGNGEKARGYRRSVLEAARNRREEST